MRASGAAGVVFHHRSVHSSSNRGGGDGLLVCITNQRTGALVEFILQF